VARARVRLLVGLGGVHGLRRGARRLGALLADQMLHGTAASTMPRTRRSLQVLAAEACESVEIAP
jgi:hypothetical protein